MKMEFDGKTILVTGGTGFFGQRFSRTVLERHKIKKLIIFSRDEAKQYDMEHDPAFIPHRNALRFFIGDVRDQSRLEMAFRDVDYVVHAAALKHISTAEYNPFECIQTNVHGAENVVKAAMHANVERVIALSTDKATSPVNLYGASKLAAEKIFVAAKWIVGDQNWPKFSLVRYGNVMASRGSVVPFFNSLIENGADSLPITDERMTRFWITLHQGIDFVLSCFPMMQGGEIFVPKIPSMKVIDVAKTLAPDLETHIVGIRPSEKLHEVMITEDEARNALELPDRYVIPPLLYGDQRHYHDEEKNLAEGFSYTSDNNPDWLTPAGLRDMLAELGHNGPANSPP
jgi:UDP-N-acetylglucosamine 4,6-dehydratase